MTNLVEVNNMVEKIEINTQTTVMIGEGDEELFIINIYFILTMKCSCEKK